MAQLPPDGQFLMQQVEGAVRLFDRDDQIDLVKFDATDANDCAQAQGAIHGLTELTEHTDEARVEAWLQGVFQVAEGDF